MAAPPPEGPDPFFIVYACVDAHLLALGAFIAFIAGLIWKAAHIDMEVKALRDEYQKFVEEYREDTREMNKRLDRLLGGRE